MSNQTFISVEFDGIRNSHHAIDDHFADVRKMVERRLTSAEKKAIKNPDGLEDQ